VLNLSNFFHHQFYHQCKRAKRCKYGELFFFRTKHQSMTATYHNNHRLTRQLKTLCPGFADFARPRPPPLWSSEPLGILVRLPILHLDHIASIQSLQPLTHRLPRPSSYRLDTHSSPCSCILISYSTLAPLCHLLPRYSLQTAPYTPSCQQRRRNCGFQPPPPSFKSSASYTILNS
jgi:hypothetical protein